MPGPVSSTIPRINTENTKLPSKVKSKATEQESPSHLEYGESRGKAGYSPGIQPVRNDIPCCDGITRSPTPWLVTSTYCPPALSSLHP